MTNNKGFAPVIVLAIILGIFALASVAYLAGKNSTPKNEVRKNDTYFPMTEQNNVPQQQQTTSCLVITSPTINQTVSFPLTITGYIDVAGAQAGTCTRWGAFEGTAGGVVVKDTNGNVKSLTVKIHTVNDYYIGMQHWPITATISSLTGVPYTNQIALYLTGDEQRDGFLPATQIFQLLTVTP